MPATKRDGLTRIQRAALAQALLDSGATRAEIARGLRISPSYTQGLLTDPDGSKERLRKERYRGVCVDCGGQTTYGPVRRCQHCAKEYERANAKWTRERIISDIQRWNEIHGEPPKAEDWLRPKEKGWPNVPRVQKVFGSWSNALEAAGFQRRINYERTDEWKAKHRRTDEWKAKHRKWTQERIIRTMQEWAAVHGRAPKQREWDGSGGKYPGQGVVRERCGSWNNAVRAAGLPPNNRRRSITPTQWEFEQLLSSSNGNPPPLPTFEERGEGRSLLEVVADLSL